MIIRLPWADPIDTLKLPEDFEDQVKESFKKYTMGTSTGYTWKDKMSYISHLPLIFKSSGDLPYNSIADTEVKAALHDVLDYEIEEGDEIFDKDDIYSFDFMCECFTNGMRYMDPLREYEPYSSSKNEETEKVMFRIMKIVMDWEPKTKSGGGR